MQPNNTDFRVERLQTLELVVLGYAEARRQQIPMDLIENLQSDFGLELTVSEKFQLFIESKKYLKATNFWFDIGGVKKQKAFDNYFDQKYQNINPDHELANTEIVLFFLHLTAIKADFHKGIFEKYTPFINTIRNHINKISNYFYIDSNHDADIRKQANDYFKNMKKAF